MFAEGNRRPIRWRAGGEEREVEFDGTWQVHRMKVLLVVGVSSLDPQLSQRKHADETRWFEISRAVTTAGDSDEFVPPGLKRASCSPDVNTDSPPRPGRAGL